MSSERLKRLSKAWQDWGAADPLYAILSSPEYWQNKGDLNKFLATGRGTVNDLMQRVDELDLCKERKRALDFGCGIGRLTHALAPMFEEVVGLDIAASMVERARSIHANVTNCTFEVEVGEDLGRFPDSHFDCVISLLVLQHLGSEDAMASYLHEFLRILRPGGALIVQLPTVVSSAPPPPPITTRRGLKRSFGYFLRGLGVSPARLHSRLDWSPEMTMTAISAERTKREIESKGGRIAFISAPETDSGGTVSWVYIATR